MSMNLGLLEHEFSALDALPNALYDVIITHTHGNLLTRARGIMQWRKALLDGQLPEMDKLCWPEETIRKTILMRIETLEIPGFCQGQESLTDSVLKDICEGISSAEDYLDKTANKFNDKLAQRQKINEKDSPFLDEEGIADHVESQGSGSQSHATDNRQQKQTSDQTRQQQLAANRRTDKGSPPQNHSSSSTSKSLKIAPTNKTADKPIEQRAPDEKTLNRLQQRWQNLANNWRELNDIDQQIDRQRNESSFDAPLTSSDQGKKKSLPGRGWDLSTGLLTSQGWRDIIRYRQRIKELPELIHFIDAIGREKKHQGNDSTAPIDKTQQYKAPASSAKDKRSGDKDVPRKALEMDGIEHGDDINRMLPAELALLCHPLLRTLWHAKRAERLLLLYQHQGKYGVGKKHQGASTLKGRPCEQGRKGKASLGRGPIIVCLDTSGSMHGEPEHIAKAAVLGALQMAARKQRPCYLIAFSGPGQMTFHRLDLQKGALIELLKFLQFSFHGGTDFSQVVKLALKKQGSEGWKKADILLVSDGRFLIEKSTLEKIGRYKKTNTLRIFGILTGNWQHDGLQDVCTDTLRIRV
ncbi:MAG: hypothetical protein COA75_04065 [Cellvibrionales bacterium]|nr:MAG: hypothetical protein COA75_04065 [Cellvibrionales bacterium]